MEDNNKIVISACLVVYNEEQVIERCLKSIAPVVDEIIVVHDGPCQDRTLEIAANYQAKIIIAPRTGEAEPIRTLSYEAAQGEWILQIDADEFLSPELQAALPSLVLEKDVEAFEFLWPLYNGERYITKAWPYKRCFFRRSAMSYLGMPNNFLVDVKGGVKKLPLLLEHRPNYNNYSWHRFSTKWVPWAKLQAGLYLKDFSEITKFNYPAKTWPKKAAWRRRFPVLIIPADFFVGIFKSLFSGAYKEGLMAWQAVLMWGLFRVVVSWHVFWGKRKKKVLIPELTCSCGNNVYKKYWYDTPTKTISVLACSKCGLARTWPEPLSSNDITEYYQTTYGNDDYFNNLTVFKNFCKKIVKLLKTQKQSGKLLDVGCNLGIFVAEARQSGFDAYGIDLSSEAIRLGQIKLDLTGYLNSGTLIEQNYPSAAWDVVSYIHCFEHLTEPDLELKEIRRVIKADGILFIEVPRFFSVWRLVLGANWYGFAPQQHVWQFGKKGLCSLLERNGFEIIKAYTRKNLYHENSFTLKGLFKIFLKVIAFITATGDVLTVVARKK